jgi:hypothetical protein
MAVTVILTTAQAGQLDELSLLIRQTTGTFISRSALIRVRPTCSVPSITCAIKDNIRRQVICRQPPQ